MLAADMHSYAMTISALKTYSPNLQKSMGSEHNVPNKTKTNVEKSHSAGNPNKRNGNKKDHKDSRDHKTTNGIFCTYFRDLENGNTKFHAKVDCCLLQSAKRNRQQGNPKHFKLAGKKKSYNKNRNAEMNMVAKVGVKEYCRKKKRRKKLRRSDLESDSDRNCKSLKINPSLLCTCNVPVLTPNNSPNPINNTSMIDLPRRSEGVSNYACFSDLLVNS